MNTAVILGPLGQSSTKLPFYSYRVPAGFPSPALDHMEQALSLDELLDIHAPHMYLVRAVGSSMIEAGLFDGDIMVVNRGCAAAHDDIVIAVINGDTCVKRLSKQREAVMLLSENPKFPPRYLMEGDELMIWGVVVASLRRHAVHG
ncbi:MAG: translesion error-prone DNA polymerase V autoproteolytic subunit [Pseudomonas sp.]